MELLTFTNYTKKVETLFNLCLQTIEKNFNNIKKLEILPTFLIQKIIEYLMKSRKLGSKTLNNNNIKKLFNPFIEELSLENFWLDDKVFFSFNCTHLKYLNLNGCLQIGDKGNFYSFYLIIIILLKQLKIFQN